MIQIVNLVDYPRNSLMWYHYKMPSKESINNLRAYGRATEYRKLTNPTKPHAPQ